jgi:DNA-binding SARP family transcriptional activator/TolB-like protein
MIHLRTLGLVQLSDETGRTFETVLAQPKRLALLVYLATAGRGGTHRRDVLLPIFWPEADQDRARDALNQALSFLRQALGPETFVRRGADEVGVDPARLRSDVAAFADAIVAEKPADALALYGGAFLDGFYIDRAKRFEEWVEGERQRLREAAARCASRLADQSAEAGLLAEAIGSARRALDLVPDDERALRRVLALYERVGDRGNALGVADAFTRRLRDQYDAAPSLETQTLIDRLRATPHPTIDGPIPGTVAAAPPADSAAQSLGEEAIRRIDRAPAPERRIRNMRTRVASVALPLAIAASLWATRRDGSTAASPSLTVLALAPSAGDTSAAYVAEGMAEDITSILAGNPRLTVKFSRAALAAGERRAPLRDVARQLEVAHVLSVGVRREGDSLHVTAHLTRIRDGRVLWSERYDRDGAGLFVVQDQIAQAASSILHAPLAARRAGTFTSFGTSNPDAYDLYLQGRYRLDRRGRDNLRIALEYFGQAIAQDPRFARAHAGVSAANTLLTLYDSKATAVDTLLALALAAGTRAVALDSTLGDAHAALGQALTYLGRREDAEREYRKAVALAPRDATAHQWFAELLLAEGRLDEAAAEMERSTQSDPLSGINFAVASNVFRSAGRFDEALRYGERAIEIDPKLPAIWEFYARVLFDAGLRDSAIRVFARRSPRHPLHAYMRARTGDVNAIDSLRRLVDERQSVGTAPNGTVPPRGLASLAIGNATAALDALEQSLSADPAFPLHDPLVDPVYDPVRDSARFRDVVRRAKLDETLNLHPRRAISPLANTR